MSHDSCVLVFNDESTFRFVHAITYDKITSIVWIYIIASIY